MTVIGLTGQSGAGKSTISRMFATGGARILDADLIARETIEGSNGCLTDLVLEFSTEIIRPDATLNREKLAQLCFSDKQKLKRLNDLTYPYIIAAIEGKIEQLALTGAPLLILDAPTLYEAGLDRRCDRVLAVLADERTRLRRIMARDSLTEEAALLRINAQHQDGFYTERADYVLRNDEDNDALRLAFLSIVGRIERFMKGEPEVPAILADVARPPEAAFLSQQPPAEAEDPGRLAELGGGD